MTTTTKRAYKLQEFVAHSLSVNCLKIGRKSSRVLVTGGEDHKVNLWAIGKPNAILSLSGHSSGIDSVSFDSSEVLVAAGAASGTIKLWDLEEAKIIRTLTGHRSNCISLDFHPFGEFFASGSLDTNLKIWDIRRKGCIHTYKGHTRGVNAIRFTPDGRWVVSGGEDNTVKLWDLTAGKLLHDFKCHEGQVQSIDFHPHEFLLATGSADRTVKFWDLETFELIGSTAPETTGVRCMTFNPDGRTLLCGLHENLKVFSWEPIRSHDTVDVGWSKLSDMNVHEGKLLGCSYNQSCVGVWVVDISRIEPYAIGKTARLTSDTDAKSNSGGSSVTTEDNVKANLGRLSISNNADPVKETRSLTRLSVPQNSDKDSKSSASTPSTPQKSNFSVVPKTMQITAPAISSATNPKRQAAKAQSTANILFNRSDVIPVIVPRNNPRAEQATEFRKEDAPVKAVPLHSQSKTSDVRKIISPGDVFERTNIPTQSDNELPKSMDSNVPDRTFSASIKNSISGLAADRKVRDDKPMISRRVDTNAAIDTLARYQHENYEYRGNNMNMEASHVEGQKGGRPHLILSNWEQKGRSSYRPGLASSNISGRSNARSYPSADENESVSASEEDTIADLIEQHDQFVGSMRSRLGKLQVVLNYWQRHDIRGALSAISKMGDQSVLADVMSLLAEKTDIVTLDICSCLLPLLTGLVESDMDRHQDIALDMLIKLVRVFGSVIYSSLSAPASVGVDIEAEQRLERCNLCYVELEKLKCSLPALSRYVFLMKIRLHIGANFQYLSAVLFCRRGGNIAKSAQELNLALQEVS
ncbi:katanin p80 WD40 repeat-containing subunit B1 homolog KTN80.4-like isoform X1 [Salvia miltiorrhiza]|uniref:katanin p80 WD40 repeat-containing subunit B1 homolog KTN80.4-like isoform X1 n=1 Tax=Salvia miltiorrhiza TaxID=226208 RepID=UPI0025AC34E4|nr:katanin p80 WD40 repeat-containing subunit B1 homolog KTN80.4-like isoform X1 [Salvia miltiorrhiza]